MTSPGENRHFRPPPRTALIAFQQYPWAGRKSVRIAQTISTVRLLLLSRSCAYSFLRSRRFSSRNADVTWHVTFRARANLCGVLPLCAGPRKRCATLGNAPHPSRAERSRTRPNVAQRPQCPRTVTPNPASRNAPSTAPLEGSSVVRGRRCPYCRTKEGRSGREPLP